MNIETYLISKLNTLLSVPTCGEDPGKGSEPYILIDKTGGRVQDMVRTDTVAVQCFETSKANAATLSEAVRDTLLSIQDSNVIIKINAGPYNYPKTSTKQHRYQIVLDVVYY